VVLFSGSDEADYLDRDKSIKDAQLLNAARLRRKGIVALGASARLPCRLLPDQVDAGYMVYSFNSRLRSEYMQW
jgi:hypothetical protein